MLSLDKSDGCRLRHGNPAEGRAHARRRMMGTNEHRRAARLAAPVRAALLAACGSYDGGTVTGGNSGSGAGGPSNAKSVEEHFAQNVAPALQFCRTCHVPGGVADVDDGRDFQLGTDPANDMAALKASWERLGDRKSLG